MAAAEAQFYKEGDIVDYTPAAAKEGGDVVQMGDGRAGVCSTDIAAGVKGSAIVNGIVNVLKTADMVILDGQPVYWDHSANTATFEAVNDKDFFLGVAYGDAAASDTRLKVDLNQKPYYNVDLLNPTPGRGTSGYLSVPVGTAAAGAFGYPLILGTSMQLELTATNEAQKVDALSVDGFAIASNWIFEGIFRIASDGSNATQDFTLGVASGTHATDFQSVAEFAAVSTVGGSTNINCQSDDGTTDVAPTDSTKDYTEGSAVANRVHVVIDGRDHTAIKFYINGERVLSATTFTLTAATGPLFVIAHLEKTSSTDTYKVVVDHAAVRLMET
jgi:predicted RecA/RadA family phage recombinase